MTTPPTIGQDFQPAPLPPSGRIDRLLSRRGSLLAACAGFGAIIAVLATSRFLMGPPEWARQKLVVLHEAGHVCCDRGGHGPDHAGIYLALVGRFIDRATMEKLASRFVETRAQMQEFQALAEQ